MMLRYLEQTTNFFGSWAPVIQLLKSDVFLKKTLKLSNEDIIGSGEYGTIYILTQDDTMAFAVKRLNRGSADRDRRFEREIEAMGDIKHRNIVTLNGYYTAPHYNLLIYELVAYEGLDGVLHGQNNDGTQDLTKIDIWRFGFIYYQMLEGMHFQTNTNSDQPELFDFNPKFHLSRCSNRIQDGRKKGKQHIYEVRNEWAKFVVKTYM